METLGLIILVVIVIALLNNKKPNYKYRKYNHKQQGPKSSFSFANEQLEASLKGGYKPQKLLNKNEIIVYKIIQSELKKRQSLLTCFAQVSCGEIMSHPNNDCYLKTVNSKRVDFCLVDKSFSPVAVIEYNGSGHSLSGDAGIRDSVKKNASHSAGLIYCNIYYGESYRDKVINLLNDIDRLA